MKTDFESKRRKTTDPDEDQQLEEQPQPPQQDVDGVDRISHLPEEVQNHILSFLEPLMIRKTTVLSKKWKSLYDKSPTIHINESDCDSHKLFQKYKGKSICMMKNRRELFLDSLRLTTKHHNMEFLKKLTIITAAESMNKLDSLISKLLDSALTTKAHMYLELIYNTSCHRKRKAYYVIPGFLLSRGSCLVSLSLQGCQFKSFDSFKLSSLKTMKLTKVLISSERLAELVSSCPSINTLTFNICADLEIIRVFNSNLKFLDVFYCGSLKRLEMDAPSLQTLKYEGYDHGSVDFNFTVTTDPEVKVYSRDKIIRKVLSMN